MHKVLNFPAYPPSFSSTASERKTIGLTTNQKIIIFLTIITSSLKLVFTEAFRINNANFFRFVLIFSFPNNSKKPVVRE